MMRVCGWPEVGFEGKWDRGKVVWGHLKVDGVLEYTGGFRGGQVEGFGDLRYRNGTTYRGMFKDGEMHGRGAVRIPGGGGGGKGNEPRYLGGDFRYGRLVMGKVVKGDGKVFRVNTLGDSGEDRWRRKNRKNQQPDPA